MDRPAAMPAMEWTCPAFDDERTIAQAGDDGPMIRAAFLVDDVPPWPHVCYFIGTDEVCSDEATCHARLAIARPDLT